MDPQTIYRRKTDTSLLANFLYLFWTSHILWPYFFISRQRGEYQTVQGEIKADLNSHCSPNHRDGTRSDHLAWSCYLWIQLHRAVLRSEVLQRPCSNVEKQEITGIEGSVSGQRATKVEVISVRKTVLSLLAFLKPCADPPAWNPAFLLRQEGLWVLSHLESWGLVRSNLASCLGSLSFRVMESSQSVSALHAGDFFFFFRFHLS